MSIKQEYRIVCDEPLCDEHATGFEWPHLASEYAIQNGWAFGPRMLHYCPKCRKNHEPSPAEGAKKP